MTIGERIQKLRIGKCYTQEYIAGQLGISRQAVHKWEKNETRPDTDNLILLAEILGTTVEYIAAGNKENKTEKKKLPKAVPYIIVIIITALLTFILTILYIANRPVSFDAGACGGGFATAIFDQYAEKLIADNHFYLTREFAADGIEVTDICPVRESRDVKYEGKAIYMSFDAVYTFDDESTDSIRLDFMGERKWIQNYKWQLINVPYAD